MKLQEQLCEWENIRLAYQNASRGKRGRGATAAFEMLLADNLLELQNELTKKTYQPGGYTSFYIHEPKKRLISAALGINSWIVCCVPFFAVIRFSPMFSSKIYLPFTQSILHPPKLLLIIPLKYHTRDNLPTIKIELNIVQQIRTLISSHFAKLLRQ
jgi:hypothetical protein